MFAGYFGNIISKMSVPIESLLVRSVIQILRPLVRILLRNGIACRVMEEAVRKVYVDEAFVMAARERNKATTAAVAAMTGLSRKEVARLRDLRGHEGIALRQRYNRAVRVISGWLNDAAYLDRHGRPRVLPVEGPTPSFAQLCKRYSGSMTTKAMLDLLHRAACIHYEDGAVRLIKHAYVPANDPAEIVQILGVDTRELIECIDHNMRAETGEKFFQRKVSYDGLSGEVTARFRALGAERAQALLEELNGWLSRHQDDEDGKEERYSVSLGIYYHESRGEHRDD